jgi:cytochrome c biogenesis factor
LNLSANPVELAALITAFAGTFFVLLFSFKTERIREMLPAAETLDSLMYKLGGVAFAGLALLLMTGAVWANESWGRYWGWDSKEVGALVAWLTYAGFLHSRIAYGWKGRRSAYFALVAFLFVIFTYLGVSYLLPGCIRTHRIMVTKDNLLFGIIGLLAGLIIGFMFTNSINQSYGTGSAAIKQNANLPAGHPDLESSDSNSASGGSIPEVQAAIEKARSEHDNFDAQMRAAELYYQIQRFEGR